MLTRQGPRVSLQQNPPMRQEEHAVADVRDLVHVVRGPKHAYLVPQDELANLGADVARHRGIERCRRLVQEQKARTIEHRLGKAYAGLLSGREHAALGMSQSIEIELVEQCPDPFRKLLHPVHQSEDAKVLVHGQVTGKRGVNGREIGAFQRLGTVRRDVGAFNPYRPRRRLEDPQDHVDGGRLPGSVRPQEPDDLARFHIERDVVDRDRVAIEPSQPVDGEDLWDHFMLQFLAVSAFIIDDARTHLVPFILLALLPLSAVRPCPVEIISARRYFVDPHATILKLPWWRPGVVA